MELKRLHLIFWTSTFAGLMLLAALACAQQTIAPFKTQQANTDFYVNMGNTTLTTIQKTVTAACAYSTATTVVILPGSNPGDTIGGLTSACTTTGIIDRRVYPAVSYTCTSGGCTEAGGTFVTSFNTRTGAVTLGAADVNAVGGITNNTSGTAANLSGTPTLPNGTTATTQTVGDNSTKLATTAFVLANAGGAVFPSTPGVVCNTSSTASANCTGEDLAKAAGIGSATSILMSTTNPTSPGIQNVFLGPGVAPNNTGATGNGDSNIVIGYNAGASMTTARDMVLIGPNAGHDYTGNGTGPDDGIYILIGADAGYHLTAASTFGISIGEDSLTNATSSASDVYMGRHAGDDLTTSSDTVAIGEHALANSASTSEANVFVGSSAGASSTAGDKSNNVGVGYNVLSHLGAATNNTAVGYQAGIAMTTGSSNILLGANAGGTVTTGSGNVIIAQEGLGCCATITGSSNLIIGASLSQLTSGTHNTAVGVAALGGVATGSYNTAIGDEAGRSGSDTTDTTLIGGGAGLSNTANGVTYIGRSAGFDATGARNTSVGNQSLNQVTTGTDNTALGDSACNLLTAAESGDICIGSDAQVAAGVSNAIQIGPGTNAVGGTTQIGNHVVIQPAGSGINGTISFGANFGATAIELYNDGASHYGWGLNAFEMQFYIPGSGANHFSWNNGNALQPVGTDELMRLCTGGALDIGNQNCTSGKTLEAGSTGQFNVSTAGALVTPSASVLASTGSTDLASFDNTTGHLADSGIPAGQVPHLNANNVFTGNNGFTGTVILENVTPATSSQNWNSPAIDFSSTYWTGSASSGDQWSWQPSLGAGANPATTFALTHTGSSGVASVAMPFAVEIGAFTVSTLPSASVIGAGGIAVVTDAATFTPGTCTGGGSDTVLAISNGTSWVCQ